MDLFVYGTLRDAELVKQLTGRVFDSQPARLAQYRKISPLDGYAYIVADTGNDVEGLLLLDVDAAALAALDRYEGEGELYRRTLVDVLIAGARQPAQTYVGIAEAHQVVGTPSLVRGGQRGG
ncbi:MAG: gamma-glutamylcyclotransferase [Deltaproteobacteria bacterium]|nr:gamma-glutamylcyclotransferase [Deltaproteobacteria bacterium]